MRVEFSRGASITLSEEPLDLGDDRARLARFREVAVATDFHRLLAIGCEGMGGERDDGNLSRLRVVFEYLSGFTSVDHGDGNVHQNEIRRLGPRLGYAFFSIQRLGDRVAEMA